MPETLAFDAYDRRLLAELQTDARLSMAELGRRVHLSQPAVTERVRKLEAAGVISGYRAQINLAALGYGIRAVVRVGRTDYAAMLRLLQDTPEVVEAFNVTGEHSWVLQIAVVDVAHLDAVVSRFCAISDTATAIILKAPLAPRPIMPASSSSPTSTPE